MYHCTTGNRVGLSPLGVVIAQATPKALSVTAFHTFPEPGVGRGAQNAVAHLNRSEAGKKSEEAADKRGKTQIQKRQEEIVLNSLPIFC